MSFNAIALTTMRAARPAVGRLGDHMRPLEMRDVEHSLCELDKLLRVRNGEGKPPSRYWPPGHPKRAAAPA